MRPITSVLVPVDFSEHSREALLYAGDLAKPSTAAINQATPPATSNNTATGKK